MDGMGKQRRPRRLFSPEFKAEIVEVCRRGDRTIGQVAKDFDLTETAVREWLGRHPQPSLLGNGPPTKGVLARKRQLQMRRPAPR